MADAAQWISGARLRTLPLALAPVLIGTGAAIGSLGGFTAFILDDISGSGDHVSLPQILLRGFLALLVALCLQIGSNYANDYSDGIRGTDDERVGPFRLVGSGAASAGAVRSAAFVSFAVAAVAGAGLVAWSGHWWLFAVGAAAIAAAWYYTGGRHPYGYRGLGEVSVFVFFGLVAVVGTTYVQAGHVTVTSVVAAVAIGCLACALMLVNNLRDVHTDATGGKRTLAVFLGERRSRLLYMLLLAVPFALAAAFVTTEQPWGALALLCAPLALATARPVARGATGAALIPVLRLTGLTELAFAVLMAVGLAIS